MALKYNVTVTSKSGNQFQITWFNEKTNEVNNFIQDGPLIKAEELDNLQINKNYGLKIGRELFRFLDGPHRYLTQGLSEASQYDEPLVLHLQDCKEISGLPFELLSKDGDYLLPYRLQLVRHLSDRGQKKENIKENRPLKMLFMACAPIDNQQELDFEKEEETLFQVTKDLAVDIKVEDFGSLEGLRRRLTSRKYDIIHLSGHMNTDNQGQPFFIMEDEVGFRRNVYPDQLYKEALIENLPRLFFLSGFQRGMSPDSGAAVLFGRALVEKYHIHAVLTWGRFVKDEQARQAAKTIYGQLSRGRSILDAVQRARYELIEKWPSDNELAWSYLCLFSTGHDLGAIVAEEQKQQFLAGRTNAGSELFVGRRRQLQKSLRVLKHDSYKVGVLLLGTGGLGKSCLAMKLSERFSDHILIIVRGKLNATTLSTALKDAFIKAQDSNARMILADGKEMKEKLENLCATAFKEKNYLLLLDDFEKNIEGADKGQPGSLKPESVDLLRTLLHYLSIGGKMTQMIITSRYEFSLTEQNLDLVKDRLEKIWFTSFQVSEQRKKVKELFNILKYKDQAKVPALLVAGHGNPELMEWLDILIGQMKTVELPKLLEAIKDKQEEFVIKYMIRQLFNGGGEKLKLFLRQLSIYRRPVLQKGVEQVVGKVGGGAWQKLLQNGMALSLVEHDQIRQSYQVTPLLRDELLKNLVDVKSYHEAAFAYYKKVCDSRESIDPILTEEWVYHALGCEEDDIAAEQAEKLAHYYADRFDFLESKRIGEWVLSLKKNFLSTTNDARLLNQVAKTLTMLGDYLKAVEYFQKSLEIFEAILGRKNPDVAGVLNNLAVALIEIMNYEKALEYLQRAINIWEDIYGDNFPELPTYLNNLGSIWMELGDHEKALDFFERALISTIKIYGEEHTQTAAYLNNMGSNLIRLKEKEEIAFKYIQKALEIWRKVFGKKHPHTAAGISNLGQAWLFLGNYTKAYDYFRQALNIIKEIYGDMHPRVASDLSNLGVASYYLGKKQEAIDHYLEALCIFRYVYEDEHPEIAKVLINLGISYLCLGEKQNAKGYFEKAYEAYNKSFGAAHPKTKNVIGLLNKCQ